MKAPFVFRLRPSLALAALAALFKAKQLRAQVHEGMPGVSKRSGTHRHRRWLSKREQKRRQHTRLMNPTRKH